MADRCKRNVERDYLSLRSGATVGAPRLWDADLILWGTKKVRLSFVSFLNTTVKQRFALLKLEASPVKSCVRVNSSNKTLPKSKIRSYKLLNIILVQYGGLTQTVNDRFVGFHS